MAMEKTLQTMILCALAAFSVWLRFEVVQAIAALDVGPEGVVFQDAQALEGKTKRSFPSGPSFQRRVEVPPFYG